MVLAIATNNAALQASAAASAVNRDMEISMERLSTGKRVNAARDDAAGVAIASRLNSEIRGTNQSVRNALDAQALIDTAEGAHKEVENLLQRMRELAVQSANGTNNADDLLNLQAELNALVKEVDRIASVTTWAGNNLMSGSNTFSFQVGSATGSKNQISVTIGSMTASTLGLATASTGSDILVIADTADTTTAQDHTHYDDGAGSANDDTALTNALKTITVVDAAIKTVNTQRAELGAVSNRLSHTVNNLTNISSNLSAAKGGIEDADFAVETTELAKNQILQQASTAMLAQANASKQNVLSLLQS